MTRIVVGRPEATAALQRIIRSSCGEEDVGAVDITNGSGFDWLRWVAQMAGVDSVMRDGVCKVCAARFHPGAAPVAVFCYRDGTWGTLRLDSVVYKSPKTKKTSRVHVHRDPSWQTLSFLCLAPRASQAWLLLQDKVV